MYRGKIVNKFIVVLLILTAIGLFIDLETDFRGTFLNDILVLLAPILVVTVSLLNKQKK